MQKKYYIAKDMDRGIGIDYLHVTYRGLEFMHVRHANGAEIFSASYEVCRALVNVLEKAIIVDGIGKRAVSVIRRDHIHAASL